MQTARFNILLLTPTFLGDASQSGVWRTPPFKALLREWWRIAAAPGHAYEHRALRPVEGDLFGNAWLEPVGGVSSFRQSRVRLALKLWDAGTLLAWEANDPRETHPEVRDKTTGQPRPVGSQLYLGYGPLVFKQGTALKANAALQAGKSNELSLAWPDTETSIPHTLQLIDWFGTIGGRGRNGWGSLTLLPSPHRGGEAGGEGDWQPQRLTRAHPQLAGVLRDLRECLRLDWPHAIGKDATGPLIWESAKAFDNWQDAMKFLARTKIGFRTSLTITAPTRKTKNPKIGGNSLAHPSVEERHVLAYPVTHHAVYPWLDVDSKGWERDERRLANQLRFKLFRDDTKLRARIYHTPHQSPLPMGRLDQAAQFAVWQSIHGWLDEKSHGLQRLGARP